MTKLISVDHYIEKNTQWNKELSFLRGIVLNSELEETIKWGAPVYTYNKKNILGIAAFKNYFGLWFFQGATLNDTHQILINAQEGKTAALRQIRFNSIQDIDPEIIKAYIEEAIQNQKDGKIIKPIKKNASALKTPSILAQSLKDNKLEEAFNNCTIAKKNEFINYILEAKQEATKLRRIDKIIPMIKDGVSLNDKYRSK